MKVLMLFTLAALVGLGVCGCATTSRYDDKKIAAIEKGSTRESDLVNWFGPPDSRNMGANGSKALAWVFRGVGRSGKLDVQLGPDGTVVSYHANVGHQQSSN